MAVPIRSQQNQPVPSIAEPDNLNKAIINIWCSQVSLHFAMETYEYLHINVTVTTNP